jgi:predicted CopG family antitoxin
MKTLNIPLEDSDYEELLKAKGEMNWRDFVLTLTKQEPKKNKEK